MLLKDLHDRQLFTMSELLGEKRLVPTWKCGMCCKFSRRKHAMLE